MPVCESQMFALPLESGEHAALYRPAAIRYQQVGVALGGEIVVADYPPAIGHGGLKVETHSDRVSRPRARRENSRPLDLPDCAIEANLDA